MLKTVTPAPPVPTLMVQGTTSDAGKSILVTGLCRVFHRLAVSVAPFKPQNMALNSAVTADGGEIGRSQAVQAMAAGIAPHTDMNPILLKPTSERGAQVIVHGQAVGNIDARAYQDYKKSAMRAVLASYHRLAAKHDLILVEGAGSPAEINLHENDIANMGFATAVQCGVLLVADIERGGVFAHLTGTLNCLSKAECALVKGMVINRFRGDRSLLQSGIDWLTRTTRIPTLGVLPFLEGLHIEAEDAVDQRSYTDCAGQTLRVVVPRLPRISNHTDFDALRLHPQVELVFVGANRAIPPCDLIILPGSKNTRQDLDWLRAHHWQAAIEQHLRYGGKLIGVCGGYQMIGRQIHDPEGLESEPGSQPGLGLMDFATTLTARKQLRRVSGTLLLGGVSVQGYEIHMGITRGAALHRPAVDLGDHADGAIADDNRIICTYLHGLFDDAAACTRLLEWAGLKNPQTGDYTALRERQIDRLADMLETELDLDYLCRQLGLSVRRNIA